MVMTTNEARWRELCRCDTLGEARAIATSIASMSFDVSLIGLDGRPIEDEALHHKFVIEVREQDWIDLADVIDEIIDEQLEFDELLERREDLVGKGQRGFLIVLVVVVSALAATGAIDL